jgi:hypothetical protein
MAPGTVRKVPPLEIGNHEPWQTRWRRPYHDFAGVFAFAKRSTISPLEMRMVDQAMTRPAAIQNSLSTCGIGLWSFGWVWVGHRQTEQTGWILHADAPYSPSHVAQLTVVLVAAACGTADSSWADRRGLSMGLTTWAARVGRGQGAGQLHATMLCTDQTLYRSSAGASGV